MPRSLPPLGWFRSFEAAARHLNFTFAAEELGMTQSAISQQIRALETRFGVQLFIRKPRGMELTDDARRLLPQVELALATLSAAAARFDTGQTDGLLTIAASVSISQWVLAPRIHRFTAKYPKVRVRFLSTIWPDDFKASIADVEIRFGTEKQVGRDAVRLGPDELIVVARDPIDGPLDQHPLIEAVGTSEGWATWTQSAGISLNTQPTIYVDSFGLALELASQGQGIALTSSLIARDALAQGRVQQIHPAAISISDGYYLGLTTKSPAATAFCDWLMAELAS